MSVNSQESPVFWDRCKFAVKLPEILKLAFVHAQTRPELVTLDVL
jgi:hypothetical protein